MNDLILENLKESDPIDYRRKYIKYKRKIDELVNGPNKYRFRKNIKISEQQALYNRKEHSLDSIITAKITKHIPLTPFEEKYSINSGLEI